jgi:peroxiredoxin
VPYPVSGASACWVFWPEWFFMLPAWWANVLMIPVWGPDSGPERVLDAGIVAHVNVRPEKGPSAEAKTSVLVHFADGHAPPLPAMGEALRRSRYRDAGIPVIVVLPFGGLGQKRSVVEKSLGSLGAEVAVPLAVTEDYEGAWTKAFGTPSGSATYLMSPEGEIAWKEQGRLDANRLALALDQHATAGTRRRSRRLPIALRIGRPIPDLLYEFAQGHDLRGRRVVLLFCKSWSTPCIKELLRLQKVHERAAARRPAIVVIADGEDKTATDELVRRHGLQFPVLADPERQMGRRFAIHCWPTTIGIRETGLIDGIHQGVTHLRRRQARSGAR